MTLETWKQEFYPSAPTKTMRKRTAIEHSLRKWRGLTKANLKKHGVYQSYIDIADAKTGLIIPINTSTCALCVKYIDMEAETSGEICRKCPLNKLLGHPCDQGINSPFRAWIDTGNPRKMIKALEKLLEE